MSKRRGRSIERVHFTVVLTAAIALFALGCRTMGPTKDARIFALSGTVKGQMSPEAALKLIEEAVLHTLRNEHQFNVRKSSFDATGFEITGFPREHVELRGTQISILSGKWRNIQMIRIEGPPGRKLAIITIGIHRSDNLSFEYETYSKQEDAKLADLIQAFVTLYDLNASG